MLKLKTPLKPGEVAALRRTLPLETVADGQGLIYALLWNEHDLLVAQVILADYRFGSGAGQHHVDTDEPTEHLG